MLSPLALALALALQAPPAPAPGAQAPGSAPVPEPDEESYYQVFKQSINGSYPTPRELIDNVEAEFGIGLPPEDAKRMVSRFTNRHNAELEEDHIA